MNLAANAGDARDVGSINGKRYRFDPGSGISPGIGNSNPLQYCLENSTDRGVWQATVHGITKSWTRLSIQHIHTTLLVRGPMSSVSLSKIF